MKFKFLGRSVQADLSPLSLMQTLVMIVLGMLLYFSLPTSLKTVAKESLESAKNKEENDAQCELERLYNEPAQVNPNFVNYKLSLLSAMLDVITFSFLVINMYALFVSLKNGPRNVILCTLTTTILSLAMFLGDKILLE